MLQLVRTERDAGTGWVSRDGPAVAGRVVVADAAAPEAVEMLLRGVGAWARRWRVPATSVEINGRRYTLHTSRDVRG